MIVVVKALFFDLSDTLQDFDWEKQWKLLIPLVNKELNTSISVQDFKQKYQQCYEVYRLGHLTNDELFFDLLFKQLAVETTPAQIKQIAKKHLEIRKEYTWLPEEYDETLQELGKHFKLAIVSSGVFPWGYYDYEKIFGFKMDKHFDLLVTSFDHGYLKDSGKLFPIALKKLKLTPSEVAFVGNSYEDDVLLAKKFGFKTVFLNKKNENLKGDLTIRKLSDLRGLVTRLKEL